MHYLLFSAMRMLLLFKFEHPLARVLARILKYVGLCVQGVESKALV